MLLTFVTIKQTGLHSANKTFTFNETNGQPDFLNTCLGGGTGRHAGLKIL